MKNNSFQQAGDAIKGLTVLRVHGSNTRWNVALANELSFEIPLNKSETHIFWINLVRESHMYEVQKQQTVSPIMGELVGSKNFCFLFTLHHDVCCQGETIHPDEQTVAAA